eukprot:7258627-Pyramimonas_sp.AAC.1
MSAHIVNPVASMSAHIVNPIASMSAHTVNPVASMSVHTVRSTPHAANAFARIVNPPIVNPTQPGAWGGRKVRLRADRIPKLVGELEQGPPAV